MSSASGRTQPQEPSPELTGGAAEAGGAGDDGSRNPSRTGLRLLCRGLVQGVGFRPQVCRLAAELGLDGSLTNVGDGVLLVLAGPRAALNSLQQLLPQALAPPARLDGLEAAWLQPPLPAALAPGSGLRIGTAAPRQLGEGWWAPALVADLAPCPDCLAELDDPGSRRHRYPFLSCSRCGPRYSIATAEPWCRAHTTLAAFPLCPACRREFDDPADRRFHAETIACPACGPRLSLRWLDPMAPAPGQAVNGAWPGDPAGRPGAGRQRDGTSSHRRSAGRPPPDDPLAAATALLQGGGILGLQGVGGFQLLVDATDAAAVARLRRRKRRPGKPFALLVAEIGWIEPLVLLEGSERDALGQAAAPIVLLRRHPHAPAALPGVAPGSPALGVMLPASPLHRLLAAGVGRPLVCTSGNRSGEPLCLTAAEAAERLAGIADALLVHDRPIARALDDSLLQLIEQRPVLLRRARGFAPGAIPLAEPPGPLAAAALSAGSGGLPKRREGPTLALQRSEPRGPGAPPAEPRPAAVIALGADLKAAPALALADRCWLAPHLGDLDAAGTRRRLQRGLAEWLAQPVGPSLTLACDAHPGALGQQLCRGLLAAPLGPPPPSRPALRPVQHHLAHGLAVVAEHGLEPPLLLVAFDGLGYAEADPGEPPGASGALPQLRGGEVLLLQPGAATPGARQATWQARTVASLRPLPLPGGERAIREPRRCALGLLAALDALAHPGAWRLQRAFAADERALLLQALAAGCQSPACSSVGRLFDAVASLLGLVQVLRYEGQGGLRLQAAALRGLGGVAGRVGEDLLPLRPTPGGRFQLDWEPLVRDVLAGAEPGADRRRTAARFHLGLAQGLATALAQLVRQMDLPADGVRVALSGGCFQNRLLLEATASALRRRGLEARWSEAVPCNDGGLALGQIWAVRRLAGGTPAT